MTIDDDEDLEATEHEQEPPSRAVGFATGLALGVLIGAVTALLVAPASGRVTRRRLRRGLEDARDRIAEDAQELSGRLRRTLRAT